MALVVDRRGVVAANHSMVAPGSNEPRMTTVMISMTVYARVRCRQLTLELSLGSQSEVNHASSSILLSIALLS